MIAVMMFAAGWAQSLFSSQVLLRPGTENSFDLYFQNGESASSWSGFQFDLYLPDEVYYSGASYSGTLSVGPTQVDENNRQFNRVTLFYTGEPLSCQPYEEKLLMTLFITASDNFVPKNYIYSISHVIGVNSSGDDRDNWTPDGWYSWNLINGFMGTIIEQGVEVGWPYKVINDESKEVSVIGSDYQLKGSVTIPEQVNDANGIAYTVTSIERVQGGEGITSVLIPKTVRFIQRDAFDFAYEMQVMKVDEQNPFYDSRDNCNAIIEKATNTMIEGCAGTVIPKSVQKIAANALDGVFQNETVEAGMRIPSGVTSIGSFAFGNNKFRAILVDAQTPPTLEDTNVFDSYNDKTGESDWMFNNTTLYIPKGTAELYQSDDVWKRFSQYREFLGGDVNGDDAVNIIDIVDIVRYVLENPRAQFDKWIGDVNADHQWTVADAVSLADIVVGYTAWSRAYGAHPSVSVPEELSLTQAEDGSLSLHLAGNKDYSAFQLRVKTHGAALKAQLNAAAKVDHQLSMREVAPGEYIIVGISMQNNAFNLGGELLRLQLNNTDGVELTDIHFATLDGTDKAFKGFTMDGTSTTAISTVTCKAAADADPLYSLDGRRVNGVASKGIYVKGTKKVVLK